MSDKQETIADIVAEMRAMWQGCEDCPCDELTGADMLEIVDHIEAAHKREVGNGAKMREALIQARAAICKKAKYQCQSLSWENCNIQANCGDILCSWRGLCEAKTAINAALAEPPRNCDVGTAEEQYERYRSQCRAQDCCDCPVRKKWDFGQTGRESCQLLWAQMPYEEGGAKCPEVINR